MPEAKKYDLIERSEKFSLHVRDFCLPLKRDIVNREYIIQLVRSAGLLQLTILKQMKNWVMVI